MTINGTHASSSSAQPIESLINYHLIVFGLILVILFLFPA